jgi:hypothetical protein
VKSGIEVVLGAPTQDPSCLGRVQRLPFDFEFSGSKYFGLQSNVHDAPYRAHHFDRGDFRLRGEIESFAGYAWAIELLGQCDISADDVANE